MQPLSRLRNFAAPLTQGSDAKRLSVATTGLICETPLGFWVDAIKAVGVAHTIDVVLFMPDGVDYLRCSEPPPHACRFRPLV